MNNALALNTQGLVYSLDDNIVKKSHVRPRTSSTQNVPTSSIPCIRRIVYGYRCYTPSQQNKIRHATYQDWEDCAQKGSDILEVGLQYALEGLKFLQMPNEYLEEYEYRVMTMFGTTVQRRLAKQKFVNKIWFADCEAVRPPRLPLLGPDTAGYGNTRVFTIYGNTITEFNQQAKDANGDWIGPPKAATGKGKVNNVIGHKRKPIKGPIFDDTNDDSFSHDPTGFEDGDEDFDADGEFYWEEAEAPGLPSSPYPDPTDLQPFYPDNLNWAVPKTPRGGLSKTRRQSSKTLQSSQKRSAVDMDDYDLGMGPSGFLRRPEKRRRPSNHGFVSSQRRSPHILAGSDSPPNPYVTKFDHNYNRIGFVGRSGLGSTSTPSINASSVSRHGVPSMSEHTSSILPPPQMGSLERQAPQPARVPQPSKPLGQQPSAIAAASPDGSSQSGHDNQQLLQEWELWKHVGEIVISNESDGQRVEDTDRWSSKFDEYLNSKTHKGFNKKAIQEWWEQDRQRVYHEMFSAGYDF
ncbi:hypothetical protein HYFRA_00012474 [Hymenoscyphus fraxineus]|uniref:Uncharacterized protein n=1 Tax=Hymenoscyphus fraxineus TaxID=746836 RepID=A0A9N9KYX0_9HELO|nr:hypothetical protein HYFRA_00012474 [Hymenoscyphus fraxineus]